MKSWNERLKATTQILAGATNFPTNQLADAASSFYFKLVAADKYKPSKKFNGNVTLIRAIDNYVQLGHDYGLSDVSLKK